MSIVSSMSFPAFLTVARSFEIAAFMIVLIVSVTLYLKSKQDARQDLKLSDNKSSNEENSNSDIKCITPLHSFDLEATAPEPIRPFVSKAVYNLTMAIQACSPEDLILLDRNYVSRLRVREATIRDHEHDIVAASKHPGVKLAVDELYRHLVQDYLPVRYPTVFTLCAADGSDATGSNATHLKIIPDANRLVPLAPLPSPIETLKILGTILDDDFILLFPSPSPTNPTVISHTAEAHIFCCPSGFSPRAAIHGKPLAAIHTPVPGYAQRLEASMDRYFARLEPGKVVKRANWSITTDGVLYKPQGNHSYAGEDVSAADAREAENLDAKACFLRVERQTLRRLPRSRAVVFSLKTYMTPLADVRSEGNGEALAEAIEGLKKGNVPEMWYYKRGEVWGKKVCEFLRGVES